jgi:hypothetical protein
MKYFSFILLILLASCNSPEEYSEEWFLEKLADPDWEFREQTRDIMQTMKDDASLVEKYSISSWLSNEEFANSNRDKEGTYLKTLKLCAANFAVMYGFIEAGKLSGETLEEVIEQEEMARLSKQYDNHIHYFYTRALEIETANFDDTNWNGNGITYYDMKDAAMSKEVGNIRDEIYLIESDDSLIELLEGNEKLCFMVRRQNPNNQNY